MGEPAYRLPEEDEPNIRPDLRSIEGGGETTPRKSGHLYNASGDDDGEDSDSDDGGESGGGRHLKALEGGGKSDDKDKSGQKGLYNHEGDSPKNLGGLRGAYGRLQNGRNKLFDNIKKHKWLWGIAGGAGVSIVGLLVILLIMLSSLAIPHLAENITAYQFAKLFRQSSEVNDRILSEKFAVWAADKPTYQKYKAKYDSAKGNVSKQWAKLDKYRPNKVISNMGTSGAFKIETKPTAWGGQRIAGVTIFDNRTLLIKSSPVKNLIPGYKFASQFTRSQTTMIQQYQLALKEGLRTEDAGPIVRGIVAKKIRDELGISLTAWVAAKFRNDDEAKARTEEAKDSAKTVQTEDPSTPTTDELRQGVDEVNEAQQATNNDPAQINEALDNQGLSGDVEKAAANVGKADLLKSALGKVNSAYAIAVPICIVYDGSLDKAGPSIDSRNTALMKESQYIQSAGDQLKDGTDASPQANQALGERLGDASTSIPLQRAAGSTTQTPSSNTSSEASPMGSYSLLDALFGSGAAVNFAKKVANKGCPVLTNVWVAGIGALANLAALFVTGGASGATEEAAGEAAETAVNKVASSFIKRSLENIFVRNEGEQLTTKLVVGKTSRFIYGQAKQFAAIAGITLAAKLYVANKAGIAANGLESGPELANNADAGSNLTSNEVMRRQFMGRPLTKQETLDTMGETTAFLAKQNEQKNVYQRYLALSNPRSFLTLFGTSLSSSLRSLPQLSTLDTVLDRLATPFASFTRLFNLSPSFAMAANKVDPVEQNYGNVQFGWSAAEEKLAAEPEYSMLENQRVLDASGQEDAIASEYGKCFAQDGETGDGSMGSLLSSGDITRDSDGNVEPDKGLCAPENLGPDDNGHFKNAKVEQVFRWRVAMRDSNGLDTVNDQQTVTADSSTSTNGSFTLAEYNMCNDSPAAHHPNCMNPPQKVPLITKMFTGNPTVGNKPFDIVGASEISPATQQGILNTLPNYDSFPKQVPNAQGRAVFWNTDVFTEQDTGRLGGIYSNSGKYITSASDDYAFPWVKLVSKDGQVVYVISSQSPNKDHGDASGSRRAADARALLAWAKSKATKNDIVVVTGDFNNSGTQHFGDNSSYCIMTSTGLLQHVHDMQDGHNPDNECPTPNPAHYAPLDSIYATVSDNLKASGWNWMGEGGVNEKTTGTDHSPSYITLTYTTGNQNLSSTTYKNPIINTQSAGESIVRANNGTFHLYATGSSGNIQHFTSKDAITWQRQPSLRIKNAPGGVAGNIWKPSVTKINNTYFMAFAGTNYGVDRGFNIYYATSSSPSGPFEYGGNLANSVSASTNGIDPQIFDDSGSYYLYWTNGKTVGLRGVALSIKGTNVHATGSAKNLVQFNTKYGDDWTIEAPYVIKRKGYYYMFFSTGDYQAKSRSSNKKWTGKRGDYMVHVARSSSPLGPFTRKSGDDQVLFNNAFWVGPGTTTMFTDDSGQDWMIYAARRPTGSTDRVSMLDKVTYNAAGWPVVNNGDGPSNTKLPGPSLTSGGGQ